MPKKQKTSIKQKGFTIIEVLIVLSIAGIMLMMVFNVIPSLLRSGRNNQRRQDVNTILEAVAHYELIDSGSMPDNCGSGPISCLASVSPKSNDYFLYYYQSKLTYYTTPSQIQFTSLSNTSPVPPINHNLDKVEVYNYTLCSNSQTPTNIGAGFNNVVALYAVESGNGPVAQCQQI